MPLPRSPLAPSFRDTFSRWVYDHAALRILFVPWPVNQSDLHESALRWMVGAQKATLWTPFTGVEYASMGRLTGLDVVYLLGHGAPGEPRLWPTADLSGIGLHLKEVCGRLLHSGLKPSWSGDLKCYSCWSACQAAANPHPTERPLALQLAAHLREHGFRCHVYGYEAETTSNARGAPKRAYSPSGDYVGVASSVRRTF